MALSKDGRVFTWGWGERGQLGSGNQDNNLTPFEVDMIGKLEEGDFVTDITAGAYATSFVVTDRGRLFAFGLGEYGILGNGESDDILTPTAMKGVSDVLKVEGGYKHSLVLTKNNDVFVFGENTFSQLGIYEDLGQADVTPTGSSRVISPSQSTSSAPKLL